MLLILNKLGFVGWQSIEPVILSALVCKHPILLAGLHGCNKTDGPGILVSELLGSDSKYQKYDLRYLRNDDFLGYADPFSLKKGIVSHIPTEISIWGADAILLDEINRVNPMVASKALELVRNRTVMGLPTKVQYVFASLNPPGSYSTSYLDPALAARFSIVMVPSGKDLYKDYFDAILDIPSFTPTLDLLRPLIEKAREVVLSDDSIKQVRAEVKAVVLKLHEKGTSTQPREILSMQSLMESLYKLSLVGYKLTKDSKASVLLSKVPSVFGVLKTKGNYGSTRAAINEVLIDTSLSGSLDSSINTIDLLSHPNKDDISYWSDRVSSLLENEDEATLSESFPILMSHLNDGTLLPDMYDQLAHVAVSRYMKVGVFNSDPMNWSREEYTTLIKSILRGDS